MKNLKQFIFEELNVIQIVKAILMLGILGAIVYCAIRINIIINLIK